MMRMPCFLSRIDDIFKRFEEIVSRPSPDSHPAFFHYHFVTKLIVLPFTFLILKYQKLISILTLAHS